MYAPLSFYVKGCRLGIYQSGQQSFC